MARSYPNQAATLPPVRRAGSISSLARVISILTMLVLLVGLCLTPPAAAAQTPDHSSLQVVASFSVLGDLAKRVGGDLVNVTTLIGPGVDAHTYDPAPADLVTLEDADVIIENGLGYEPWLDRYFASTQPAGLRVVASDGIAPRQLGPGEVRDEEDHGQFDPHVWHNVANAIVMVGNIRDALVAADPAHAAEYKANAAATTADLQALDAWVREQVATLPPERRKLVTSHDTFGYFADAYGFTVVGTALGSLSTEAGDPSAREIATLIDEIAAAGVPAIFAENVSNPDLMNSIAAEAGVVLAPPLYSDALGPAGSPGDTYDGMIRSNVTTIVSALSQ
ncbi:MAG: zinc ABC transporter substrate-binding protein [Thermomicrobiales bacterium]